MTRIRPATTDDASAVAAIHNAAIAERSATFDTRPRSVEDTALRIADGARHPLLVATDDTGAVLGWAGLGSYRTRECYAGVAEVSVYLAGHARGRGIGRQLLQALIDRARQLGHWKLLSRIFLFNIASRALCRSLGFREVGIYQKHAQLDGRWLDVVIVERLLLDDALADGTPAGNALAHGALADHLRAGDLREDAAHAAGGMPSRATAAGATSRPPAASATPTPSRQDDTAANPAAPL